MEALALREMDIGWEADICRYLVLDDEEERGVSVVDMIDMVEDHSGVKMPVVDEQHGLYVVCLGELQEICKLKYILAAMLTLISFIYFRNKLMQ